METLLPIIFVLVDDQYETQGQQFVKGKVGRKPRFKDSEMMTLLIVEDFIPYPGELPYLNYIRANYGALFPELVD